MPPECPPLTRSLYAWEIQEARRVFAGGLAYESIRVHECASWPDTIDRIGRILKRMPASVAPNAVTLGNQCYFPVRLLEALPTPADPEYYKFPWLIHELTHAWQYQHLGWLYLIKALSAQFGQGAQAYDFGGQAGLLQAIQQGCCLADFNPEQQGDICRTYYERVCFGQDVTAWQPFIQEIQSQI
jgi:hypothetical protein